MRIQQSNLINEVNETVVVTELTRAAARDSIRILSWLRSNAPGSQVFVVANLVHPNALEISRKDFEQSIEHKIDVLIPADPKLAAQAAKLGKTLAEVAKGNRIGHALENMMQLAMGAGEESVEGKIEIGRAHV